MKKHLVVFAALAVVCSSVPLVGQQDPPISVTLETELDEFRNGLFKTFNEGKYEEMLKEFCHEDVIATWQDGNSCRGYQEVLAEFEKLAEIIERIQVAPTVEERLVLDGGKLVISTGQLGDTYELKRGETVALNSVWAATIVKSGDKWQLVSFSGSANAFDNSVIRLYFGEARNWATGIAALIGIAVGGIVTLVIFRSRKRRV